MDGGCFLSPSWGKRESEAMNPPARHCPLRLPPCCLLWALCQGSWCTGPERHGHASLDLCGCCSVLVGSEVLSGRGQVLDFVPTSAHAQGDCTPPVRTVILHGRRRAGRSLLDCSSQPTQTHGLPGSQGKDGDRRTRPLSAALFQEPWMAVCTAWDGGRGTGSPDPARCAHCPGRCQAWPLSLGSIGGWAAVQGSLR